MPGKLPSFFKDSIEAMLNLCLTVYIKSQSVSRVYRGAIYLPVYYFFCSDFVSLVYLHNCYVSVNNLMSCHAIELYLDMPKSYLKVNQLK